MKLSKKYEIIWIFRTTEKADFTDQTKYMENAIYIQFRPKYSYTRTYVDAHEFLIKKLLVYIRVHSRTFTYIGILLRIHAID